jgi:diacylglycerol kinase (ATP)
LSSHPQKGVAGLRRLWNAFFYSCNGLVAAWRHEAAFRQEVLLAIVALPLGIWLGADGIERALLVGSVLLILIVELLNSAVETVVNRISVENHELSGRAKDIGSAAVLLALANALAVWGFLLAPRLF